MHSSQGFNFWNTDLLRQFALSGSGKKLEKSVFDTDFTD
ncbi:hypothetical protein FLGE108171_08570 [Flavobacterium gelidilacus]